MGDYGMSIESTAAPKNARDWSRKADAASHHTVELTENRSIQRRERIEKGIVVLGVREMALTEI